jgi:hypothetical protein
MSHLMVLISLLAADNHALLAHVEANEANAETSCLNGRRVHGLTDDRSR